MRKLEAVSGRTSEGPELYEVEDGTEGKLLWSEYIDEYARCPQSMSLSLTFVSSQVTMMILRVA